MKQYPEIQEYYQELVEKERVEKHEAEKLAVLKEFHDRLVKQAEHMQKLAKRIDELMKAPSAFGFEEYCDEVQVDTLAIFFEDGETERFHI